MNAPKKEQDVIISPLKKKLINGIEKVVVDPKSEKKAKTKYKVLEKKKGLALIEVYPQTGRTHQIRVHLLEIKAPILGDKKYYSEKSLGFNQNSNYADLHLHAKKVSFMLGKKKYNLKAEIPNHFKYTLKANKFVVAYE